MDSRWLAADFQFRIQIAGIAKLDARGVVLVRIGENLVPRQPVIEETHAERRGFPLLGRQKQYQALDRDAPLALAQIVQPDKPKTQHAGGMQRVRRRSDGGQSGCSALEQGAWISRRKTVFQIRFGREFIDFPRWELARQELPEPLAKDQACTPALPILACRAREVQKKERTP